MNYEDQIIGLKRVIVDLQKRVNYLESEKDIMLKTMLDESNEITKNFKNVTVHLKRIYSALNPIEAKIFPAARAARRQLTALARLQATAEPAGRKKH